MAATHTISARLSESCYEELKEIIEIYQKQSAGIPAKITITGVIEDCIHETYEKVKGETDGVRK